MHNTKYVLERFRKAEEYPEATEESLLEYLTDLLNNSASTREEAQEVLWEYLEFLNVDPDSIKVYSRNGQFEVDFS
ncbi:MAG: hypothetical protein PWQ67_2298 [Clostridia bacterium]|jgi:hypothetical protein|nr:hypothetical protein [Clostridia bacterium]MDN5323844.1 hypothetical protein [Clostridia bacterium]